MTLDITPTMLSIYSGLIGAIVGASVIYAFMLHKFLTVQNAAHKSFKEEMSAFYERMIVELKKYALDQEERRLQKGLEESESEESDIAAETPAPIVNNYYHYHTNPQYIPYTTQTSNWPMWSSTNGTTVTGGMSYGASSPGFYFTTDEA